MPCWLVDAETIRVGQGGPDRKIPCAVCQTPDATTVGNVRKFVVDSPT